MPSELDQAVDAIEAALADPSRRREIAQRFIELEQRVGKLENELERVDQRLTKARLDRWDVP
jgi:multidrug resistance efflux pump